MARPTFTVCVYCGSRSGRNAAHAEAARTLGRQIGERGWRLVYGGGRAGLMGVVADAALAAGATVVGIIPDSLMQREVGHTGLSELQVVPTMHERKHRMAEHADAFVALPGGLGTLEELFEVWTWRHLGYHAKPVALLDTAGYYTPMLHFLQRTEAEGFTSAEQQGMLLVDDRVERLLDRIAEAARLAPSATDLSRI